MAGKFFFFFSVSGSKEELCPLFVLSLSFWVNVWVKGKVEERLEEMLLQLRCFDNGVIWDRVSVSDLVIKGLVIDYFLCIREEGQIKRVLV